MISWDSTFGIIVWVTQIGCLVGLKKALTIIIFSIALNDIQWIELDDSILEQIMFSNLQDGSNFKIKLHCHARSVFRHWCNKSSIQGSINSSTVPTVSKIQLSTPNSIKGSANWPNRSIRIACNRCPPIPITALMTSIVPGILLPYTFITINIPSWNRYCWIQYELHTCFKANNSFGRNQYG